MAGLTLTEGMITDKLRLLSRAEIGVPVLLLMMLAMMILPMPPFLLDLFFTFNIALALIVLLASIYVDRPLDFSVFPTMLLMATLLRLALIYPCCIATRSHWHRCRRARYRSLW